MSPHLKAFALAALAGSTLLACSRDEGGGQPQYEDQRPMIEHARQRRIVLESLETMSDGVEQFHIELGRFPSNLYEVVRVGYVKEVPPLPQGMQYMYDPVYGHIQVRRVQPPPDTP